VSDIIVEIASTPPNYIVEVAFGTKGEKGDSVFTYLDEWDSMVNYVPNDVVHFQGSGYVCIQLSVGNPPFVNPTYWQLMAAKGDQGDQGDPGNVYTPTGEWDNGTNYIVNDLITYLGSSYVCIANHHSATPPNVTYWQLLAEAGTDGGGVPAGGTAAQLLAKIDGTDFNTEWVDPSIVTGNANTVARFDGSGVLASFDELQKNSFGGLNYFSTQTPSGLSQTDQILNNAINIEPSVNSPNQTVALFQNNINIDTANTGFSIGTNGRSVSIMNSFINHQGTSDLGNVSFFDNNFTLGNGTDPISVNGLSYFYGFGQIANNVTVNNQIQGYGFQINASAGATLSSNVNGFYDFANFSCAVPGYNSFIASPTIAEIPNNNNYNGVSLSGNFALFSGNAGFFGLNISPTITNFSGDGTFFGININPTISAGGNYCVGINISMDNIVLDPGVKSSLTVQDLFFESISAGASLNGIEIQYINDGTAGAETVGFSNPVFMVHMQSGVSTATQIKAALEANGIFATNITCTISGVGSNAQTAQTGNVLAGGIDGGRKQAAYFDGDVEITGGLSFGGALSVGALNAFGTAALTDGGGQPSSIHSLITQPTVAANAVLTSGDLLGVNTAMLLQIGDNATVATAFIGVAALGLPAVITMGAGSTLDKASGATFALSLDAGAGGGTIARLDLCRALAIPNGITTVTTLYGYKFDLPFGDPGSTTWGFYAEPAAHNYFAGDLMIGGTPASDDVVANSSVGLEIKSTTKAFLNARMTTAERDALTAINGMQLYNVTTDKLQVYAGGSWVDLH